MSKLALANLAAAAAATSVGASVVATRLVVGEIDPVTLAFHRYVIAVICLAPMLPFIWPKRWIGWAEIGKIAALGALFFGLFPWAFSASLQYTTAARGAISLATIPIQTLIIAAIFGHERLTRAKTIGVSLAFAGILVVFGPEALAADGGDYLFGDGLMFFGAACAALYSVFGRATFGRHGPMFVTVLAMIFGVLALLPLWLAGGATAGMPRLTTNGWLAVLFLGTVGGALQFTLFTWALRWLPPTRTVIYLTLNPISAMFLAVLLLGEAVTASLLIGLLFVLGAIFLANPPGKSGRQPVTTTQTPSKREAA